MSSERIPRPLRFCAVTSTVALAALFAPGTARARDITFAEARAAAERTAPDVKLAERRADVSNADVKIAGALTNPTFTVSTASQTARLGTSLDAPLPLFGQRGTSVKAARADATASLLDVQVAVREALWQATVGWVDLWEAQERARLLEIAASDAERLVQIASEKFDAGTGPRLDVVRTKADGARAASEAESARRLAAGLAARLAPWIGAAPDETLTATGTPGYPEPSLAAPDLETSFSNNPTLQRDRAQVTAAELHIKNEERLRWPIVTPQITVNQNDPTLPGTDVIVGIAFDLPILNVRGGAIARAQAQRALAETTVMADERKLHAELLDAYRRTEGASVRLHALREQVVPSMKEAADMTEESYRSGRTDLIHLIEAQRTLRDSRLAEAEAAASWTRAVADLEKATGSTLTEGGTHAP